MDRWDYLIAKDELGRGELRAQAEVPLQDGEARLAVESFSVTANNVTYGAMGDAFGYWQFFPAPEGFGRVPVWGFATVVESKAEGIEPGLRLFGYLPMSSHFVARLQKRGGGYVDAAEHRAGLPPTYNEYAQAQDPTPTDDHRSLLRPLFTTSWLIDDFLAEADDFGAKSVILTSASSKTALGLAYQLSKRGVAVIGLTSPAHVDFLKSLGWFATVAPYSDIEAVAVPTPVAIVDFSGNAGVVGRLHGRFGDAIVHSAIVGATHWDAAPNATQLPGPARALFFAPDQIRKRFADWGAEEFGRRYSKAMADFIAACPWLKLRSLKGPEGLAAAWTASVGGTAPADTGFIVKL
ncbi:MAG: hypothetical protein K0R83_1359 [Caulobacter sp.]|jgi:hypothetical protein|nr:hypothetical protein [Caulobacter sp.]